MKRIVVLNGPAGVGKDTLIDRCRAFLAQYNIPTHSFSAVDEVKQIALAFGWDGVKDEAGRQLLSDIKHTSIRYNDGPTKYLDRSINSIDEGLIFLHIREPEEIAKIVGLHPEIIACHLERPGVEVYANVSDQNTRNYAYHHYLNNDGDLDKLTEIAEQFAINMFPELGEGGLPLR